MAAASWLPSLDWQTQGNLYLDPRAFAASRLHRDMPLNQPHTFVHADQSERAAARHTCGIESATLIRQDEEDFVVVRGQFNFRADRAAMPHHILQSFLDHAVQAKRGTIRQSARYIVRLELDIDLVCSAEFPAQATHGGDQTELLQFRRVQIVRETMHGGRHLLHSRREFLHPSGNRGARGGWLLAEHFQLDGQQRNEPPRLLRIGRTGASRFAAPSRAREWQGRG